jgi:hypothetical protein
MVMLFDPDARKTDEQIRLEVLARQRPEPYGDPTLAVYDRVKRIRSQIP